MVLVGLSASIFIIVFEPFDIGNSFYFIRLGSRISDTTYFSKLFKNWTLGKAFLWYPLETVLVGGSPFLYESWWGGWYDFSWLEFLFVIGRTLSISFIVAFFILGIWQYFDRRKIALISSKEDYAVTTLDGKILSPSTSGQEAFLKLSLLVKEWARRAHGGNFTVFYYQKGFGRRNDFIFLKAIIF